MNSSLTLSITTFVYGFSAFLYLVGFVFRRQTPGVLGTWVALLGLIGNTAGIGMRWVESYRMGIGHAPLSNLYESLVFFALTITLLYLFIERRYGNRVIGAFTMPLAFMAMAYASLSPNISDRIQPLLPALKSNWLTVHVVTCFIGYAAFAIAFGLALMYLIKKGDDGHEDTILSRVPHRRILDELNHQMVLFGFLFLSAGIISGAVWANSAWGRYWGWDPKETWSLITWLLYAALLHQRLRVGWRGKKAAIMAIVGFGAVLFTFLGVNLLLGGLHTYVQWLG